MTQADFSSFLMNKKNIGENISSYLSNMEREKEIFQNENEKLKFQVHFWSKCIFLIAS